MATERNANSVPTLLAKSNAGDDATVILWADPSTHRLLVNASVTVGAVSGDRTSNTAVPGATNIGALVGIATAAAPSYTEGYLVGLSTDLSGALRVTGSLSVGGTTDNSAFTAGTSTGTPAMGFYHSTIDTVTDGRAAAVAITPKRAQHVALYNAAGTVIGDATTPMEVSIANTGANATAIKVNVASGGIASGAIASGAIASGAVASGAFASGSISSGAIAAGAIAAGATSIAENEDVASADGDRGVKVLFKRLDTPANSSGTDGDYEQPQMSAGRLWVSAKVDTALPAGTNGIGKLTANSGVTIGAVEIAAAQTLATVTTVSTVSAVTAVGTITPGTAATSLGKAEDAAHTSGDVGVFSLGVANEAQSSLAADGDYIAQATDTKGNNLVAGNIAHDGVDAGAPVKVGAKAVSAEPTAVAANDRANLISDLVGKLIVLPYANPENFVSGAITSAMTGTTSTSLIAAPASGLRNYITNIVVSNSHATVGTDVIIQDGSGGTTLYTIPAAAVYGGASVTFPVPLRQPTTATAIYCANVTTGASTKVSATGYKGA